MISCITTTYNRPKELERAIKSIEAQTFKDWEHIVVLRDEPSPIIPLGVVGFYVLRMTRNKLEVLDSIIKSISVFMMNPLILVKVSPKMLFHHKPVLKNISPTTMVVSAKDHLVSIFVDVKSLFSRTLALMFFPHLSANILHHFAISVASSIAVFGILPVRIKELSTG